MRLLAALLFAVAALACSPDEDPPPAPPYDPAFAQIVDEAVVCAGPDERIEFGLQDLGVAVICQWNCIAYRGHADVMVRLQFIRYDDAPRVWAFAGEYIDPGRCP